jgi:pimeloyl-ACP methyl ester carboxylesterase
MVAPSDDHDPSPADRPGLGERPSHPAMVVAGCIAIVAILVAVVVATAGLASQTDQNANTQSTAPAGSFYTPPSPLPAGPPGTIIASQPITTPPPGTQGWRILYLSTAFDTDQPIAVSGTVFAPTGPPPATPRPVVAWAHGTTGIAPACAPSIPSNGGANTIPGLDAFIGMGYVVTATDYPGLGTAGPHPYLVGVSEGRATLDSVRAAHRLTEAGAGTEFVAWGHSQGGQAALFSGQLAPSYAPDLHLVGVAAAAPATELATLLQLDAGSLTGNALTSLAVVSWSQVYPNAPLESILDPIAIPVAHGVADHCVSDVLSDLPLLAVEKLQFLKDNPATTEPWATFTEENSVSSAPIDAPMFVVQGTADEIVHPSVTVSYLIRACRSGASMQYQAEDGIGHIGVGFAAAPAVVLWTRDRFNNVFATNGCESIPGFTEPTATGPTTATATPATNLPTR